MNFTQMTSPPDSLQQYLLNNTPQPLFPEATTPSAQNTCQGAEDDYFKTTFASVESMTNFINTNTELAESAAQALKVGSCSYIQGNTSIKIPFAKAEANFQASTGCESVALYMSVQQSITNTLQCSSNYISNNIQNTTILVQQIVVNVSNVKTGGSINIGGGGQSVNVNFNMVNFTNSDVQKTMSNDVQNTLNNLQQNLQSTKNQAFSQPTSQKSLQTSFAATLTNISSLDISNIINTTVNNIFSIQGQTITVSNDIVGQDININIPTQSQIASGIIQSIENNIMSSIFTDNIKNDLTNDQYGEQKQQNTGPDNGMGILTIIIAIIVIIIIGVVITGIIKNQKPNQKVGKDGKIIQSKMNYCTPNMLLIISKYGAIGIIILGIVLFIWGIIVKFTSSVTFGLVQSQDTWIIMGVVFFIIGIIIFIVSFIMTQKRRAKCLTG